MNSLVVGIADCQIIRERDCVVVTHALGSCIAVAVHDGVAGVGGMLHFMLPSPELVRTEGNPFRCAQTGIPLLLNRAYALGADKRRLSVYLAGGAQMMDQISHFNVGGRNHTAARQVLWKLGLPIAAERVGGNVFRTVGLDMRTGRFWVQERGAVVREFLPERAARRELR